MSRVQRERLEAAHGRARELEATLRDFRKATPALDPSTQARLDALRAETRTLEASLRELGAAEAELLERWAKGERLRLAAQDEPSAMQRLFDGLARLQGRPSPPPMVQGATFVVLLFMLLLVNRASGLLSRELDLALAGAAAVWLLADAWHQGRTARLRAGEPRP